MLYVVVRRYGDTTVRRYSDTTVRRYGDTAVRRYVFSFRMLSPRKPGSKHAVRSMDLSDVAP